MNHHSRLPSPPLFSSFVFSTFLIGSATAQTVWNAGWHNWFNESNWTGGVPSATTTILIDNNGMPQIGSYPAEAGVLFVGSSNNGSLEIISGSLTSQLSYIAFGASSTGLAKISGGQWDSVQLSVGVTGDATVEISGTGKVATSVATSIATNANSTSLVKISGGSLISDDMLDIGVYGKGTLEITGGTVSDDRGSIGRESGSTGLVKISGGTWTNSGYLDVGEFGHGTLEISGTGKVTNTYASIGRESDSTGLAKINGGEWVSTYFDVGNKGSGTLEISNGIVRNDGGVIGRVTGATGRVTVSGGQWINNGTLFVGNEGSGNLQISGAGAVSSQAGVIGGNAGSWGNVGLNGGSWTNSGDLTVGGSGLGALSLRGGNVHVDDGVAGSGGGTVFIAAGSGSTGTLDFGLYGGATSAGNLIASTLSFGSGSGAIRFNQADTLEVTHTITGNGKLIQLGSGTTHLAGISNHTGGTEVLNGTLRVTGSSTGSTVTVKNGGTLGGSGLVSSITLESGGFLSPGNSIGTLTVGDDLLWNAGAIFLFDLGAGESDLLTLGGDLLKNGAGDFSFLFHDAGWLSHETYTLIQFDGLTDFTAADFRYLNNGPFEGYFSVNQNAVQFTLGSVPEPTTAMFLLSLLGSGMLIRRRPSKV